MDMCMRYAHCEGHTDLVFDSSGRYLITCGTDGDIRVFDGFEDDDPKTHHMGEAVNALAFKNGTLYLSTDSNAVLAYTFPDIACDGVILQFFTAVYHIVCSNNDRFVAAGGGDFDIKVYDKETKNFRTCMGHDAPILSLDFDPEDKYLASSSCDGTVRIWQLLNFSSVKILSVIKKSNDFCNSETLCRLKWHPRKGEFLIVPVEHELRFYQRGSWTHAYTLQDENTPQIISLAAFSSCGLYVAAAANNGAILVWDTRTRKCIGKRSHSKNLKVCSLVWNPSGKKEIAFCDIEGQMGLFDEINVEENKKQVSTKPEEINYTSGLDSDDEFGLDETKEENAKVSVSNGLNNVIDNNDDDDDSLFDIGAIKARLEPKIYGINNEEDTIPTSVTSKPVEHVLKPVEVPTTPLQTSFQPSSTPLHLEHRFMLWNSVGIVRCYNTEEEHSIDVEFHDASVYHPVHVNNFHGFTMASLSTEALLLASPKTDEASSKLQCLHIGTWDSNKEWTIDMIEDEEIEAITLGSGWAAAATDKRFLRLFTVSGVQCEVFCLPGPVVCLAATEDHLAIAYHRGAGITGEQNLGLLYVNVNLRTQCICKDYALPLTSKSYLAWMGFSDEGQLCIADTSGEVRKLNISNMAKWTPIANTKSHTKGKSDNYFVVGLSEIQQEIRCIPCKGSRYPNMLPRPTVTVLPFSLPFCEMGTDKGRLEEEQARLSMLHSRIKSLVSNGFDLDSDLASVERKWTDVLLKIFALATRTDREYRALDITSLMPNHRVVQGAIKYATQRHHMALAERLSEVVHKKIMEEASETKLNEVTEEEEEFPLPVASSSINTFISRTRDAEEKLRPKPLPRRKHSAVREADRQQQESDMSEIENTESFLEDSDISLLPKSPMTNPFKVQSRSESNDTKANTSGIDDVLCESTRKLSSKVSQNSASTEKKPSRQSKLFMQKEKLQTSKTPVAPKKFGFPLFLDENKDRLKAENPTLDDGDLAKMATKLFKELPPHEKEKYKAKPKKICDVSNTTSASKRKEHDTEEISSETKKSKQCNEISTGTNFSMFAFVKKNPE